MSDNEKTAGANGGSSEGNGIESNEHPHYTTKSPAIQEANIFEAAQQQAGTITPRQLRTLDSMRNGMDSDRFNEFRAAVGIADWTPNYKLSKQTAAALIARILAAQEAGQ